MTIKRTFAITTILASIVMMAISGTTQSANAQIFGSNAIPNDADALLVEIIDGSGSINDADFQLQLNGLVAGLQATYDALAGDPQLDLFGESYVIVIQVSSPDVVTDGAVTECTMEVDTTTDLSDLLDCIANITQITNAQGVKGDTCTSCGFNLAVAELANVPAEFLDPDDDVQIIDLITDGNPFPELNQVALDAEDAAIAAGYDRVVAIGISDGVDSAFLASIVDPNPPGAINPVPLPEDDGFVITVDDFTEFAPALERKLIGTIVVCPPGTFLPPGGIPPDDCEPLIGGEFLPVDSTALLIAGMSANMSLIVPIAAGSAGVGAYLIRSRMSKD